jgi:hypothetical protein
LFWKHQLGPSSTFWTNQKEIWGSLRLSVANR